MNENQYINVLLRIADALDKIAEHGFTPAPAERTPGKRGREKGFRVSQESLLKRGSTKIKRWEIEAYETGKIMAKNRFLSMNEAYREYKGNSSNINKDKLIFFKKRIKALFERGVYK